MNYFQSIYSKFQQRNPILLYTITRSIKFISWIPVIYLFSEHFAYIGIIDGISMKPTFNPDNSISKDRVLLWKFNIRNNLKINDIVFIKSPINPNQIHTKRIKGLQLNSIIPRYPETRSKILIPLNHIWVEGDNIHSIDSNTYGPLSNGMVVAKAVWIIWPLNRFGPIPANGGRECREDKLRYNGSNNNQLNNDD